MLTFKRSRSPRFLTALILSAAALSLLSAPAQGRTTAGPQNGTTASVKPRPATAAGDEGAPPFHDYKGVSIGMSAEEARKKLGVPADKGDKQDFYSFSDTESAQVFYDGSKQVFAISVFYVGGNPPTAKAVLGTDAEAKPDGSVHKLVDYPKGGYWVSYSRTPGDSPMVTVTMQKKQ